MWGMRFITGSLGTPPATPRSGCGAPSGGARLEGGASAPAGPVVHGGGADSGAGRGLEPARLSRPEPVLEDHPPEAHARRLLAWLRDGGNRGRQGDILTPEMLEIYQEMCMEILWRERAWNPIAHELTRLTTGRKVYCWIRDNGRRRRVRVYPIEGVTDSWTAAALRRQGAGDGIGDSGGGRAPTPRLAEPELCVA